MNRDPAPPLGVTFTREFPVEVLGFVDQLLNNWGIIGEDGKWPSKGRSPKYWMPGH